MQLRSKKRYREISPCSSSTRSKKRITTETNPKTKRRLRSSMTNHLDKSAPAQLTFKRGPTASSPQSVRSWRSGSVSNSENWYLSLCVAIAELRKQKYITLPEVTRMEHLPNGLFQNEATARVFLYEQKMSERVAMIKDIFDANKQS